MKKIYFILMMGFSFVGKAQIINFPDANFKATLLEASTENSIARDATSNPMKIDANNDHEIQVSEALAVRILDVNNRNIASITGINNFANLTAFYCYSNVLTSLNISGMQNLGIFGCDMNQLTTLEMNDLPALKVFNCKENNLTALDVTQFPNLEVVTCRLNQLATISVTGLSKLSFLDCSFNQLSTLYLHGLSLLRYLNCDNNRLLGLDFNHTPGLTEVQCSRNEISFLDFSMIHHALEAACYNNQLIEIRMNNGFEDTIGFNTNEPLLYMCVDAAEETYIENLLASYGYYSVNVSTNCALAVADFEKANTVILYPNPATNILYIQSENNGTISSLQVYNILGQLVKKAIPNESAGIDVSALEKGNYFVKVDWGNGISNLRFVKN